jgi:hypothetical protein
MAINTIADLDATAANNTNFLNSSTQGTADANTIDTLFQNVAAIIARGYGDIGGLGAVGGTANAISLTSLSTYQTLEPALLLTFKAASANTTAATLNLDGLGAKAIRRQGDTALSANDIVANGRYLIQYDADYNTAAGAWVLLNPSGSAVTGTTEVYVSAGAFIPQITNGPAAGIVEMSTNKQPVLSLDFDTTTQEYAVLWWIPPKRWDRGTITFTLFWTAASGSGGVAFSLQGAAISNDDALDAAYGTAITVTDTLITANDCHVSAASAAITIAGTPAAADLIALRLSREVANGSDTLAVDAKVLGIVISYNASAGNDA